MLSKRTQQLLTTVPLIALITVSCSNDENDELVFVETTETMTMLNPQIAPSPANQQVASSMLEPLVRITDEYEVVPWLAHEWETSEDGRSTTFYLEEGVSWHDGEPFTSDDVKFNLEEIIGLNQLGSELAGRISSVETPDDHTVVVELEEPHTGLLEILAFQFLLPKHIYEGTDYLENEANNAPIGTGPLIFDEYTESESVEVVANEEYWRGEMQIDRVIFSISLDGNANDLAILGGEIDRRGGVSDTRIDEFESNPDVELTSRGIMPQIVMALFNAETEKLADPEVRQLVYSAIDKEQIIDTALPEGGHLPEGVFPPELYSDSGSEFNLAEELPYDVDAINEGLDEAGFPRDEDGHRFTLRLSYMSALPNAVSTAEVVQSSLAEVGIDVELVGLDIWIFMEQVFEDQNFDMAIQFANSQSGVTRQYRCNPDRVIGSNPSGICDERIDEAIDNAITAPTQEEREQYIQEFELAATEQLFSAPVVHLRQINAYNTSRWTGHDYSDGLFHGDWLAIEPVN